MAGNPQPSPSTTFTDTPSTTAAETNSSPSSRDPNCDNTQPAKPASPSQKHSTAPSVSHTVSQPSASKSISGSSNSQRHHHHHHHHHLSSPSISSQRSGGILAFAQAALDKIAEPRVRTRQSLGRLSTGPDFFTSPQSSPDRSTRPRPSVIYPTSPPTAVGEGKHSGVSSALKDPPSQPYSKTDPTRPPPIHVTRQDNKMHQTSSRLLRMTDDDRPFTKVSF